MKKKMKKKWKLVEKNVTKTTKIKPETENRRPKNIHFNTSNELEFVNLKAMLTI